MGLSTVFRLVAFMWCTQTVVGEAVCQANQYCSRMTNSYYIIPCSQDVQMDAVYRVLPVMIAVRPARRARPAQLVELWFLTLAAGQTKELVKIAQNVPLDKYSQRDRSAVVKNHVE
jgi:hypothetical protein